MLIRATPFYMPGHTLLYAKICILGTAELPAFPGPGGASSRPALPSLGIQ